MPLVVMVVGPIVEAVISSVFLVAAVMLPLTCMAAADSMVTSARCRRRLAGKKGAPTSCCLDAAGYDTSDDEGEEAEEAGSPPQKAASASEEGLRQRVASVGGFGDGDQPPNSPPERALSQ